MPQFKEGQRVVIVDGPDRRAYARVETATTVPPNDEVYVRTARISKLGSACNTHAYEFTGGRSTAELT
jgi:hypothetical protein